MQSQSSAQTARFEGSHLADRQGEGPSTAAAAPGADVRIPLGDILAFHAARAPDRPALTHEGVTLTHAELDLRANRRARQLAGFGVVQGDFVVLALPNGLEFFETTFALWKLGAVPCPVSPRLPDAELSAIVDLIAPRVVVGPEASRLSAWPTVPAGSGPGPDVSAEPLPPARSPFWKALTSGGSTGRPKVIVTHVDGAADPMTSGYLLQRVGETILNPGPLYHNAAFSAAHQCLFAGGHVVNMERFDAETALRLIDRHKVGHVVFVPTMMNRIWRLPTGTRQAYDLSSLNVVLHLAAACPIWLKEQWIAWLGCERVFEVYAGTEGVGATLITGREWLDHKGSVGRPAPGVGLRILDPEGRDCGPGDIGEIYFRSAPNQAKGYHYIGAEASTTPDGWASLGDLGRMDADGYLYLSDRRTDMIVSGGVNVYPAEVEAALDRHPLIRSSIVIGLPDEDLGARVHAIVQVAPEARADIDSTTVAAFLAEHLVRYKIPRSFEFVGEDLRDDAGKARRLQLREQRLGSCAAG